MRLKFGEMFLLRIVKHFAEDKAVTKVYADRLFCQEIFLKNRRKNKKRNKKFSQMSNFNENSTLTTILNANARRRPPKQKQCAQRGSSAPLEITLSHKTIP